MCGICMYFPVCYDVYDLNSAWKGVQVAAMIVYNKRYLEKRGERNSSRCVL